jgi:UDPglucose 6-dehydrogenase
MAPSSELCHSPSSSAPLHLRTQVADYWHSVVRLNDWQKERFARTMVSRMFNSVTGKKIAILGFAFKKDTGDVRESAAAYVAKALLGERAQLHIFDPKVRYCRAGGM